jgi:carbonic anhydrase
VQKLARGVHQFRAQYFSAHQELFEQLAENGQRPETLFITCSDSRVVPNLITNAAPGELFIVRNVGNIVPSATHSVLGGVAAAIEYAVQVLAVENVIVCGHTGCGAIEAIMSPERFENLRYVPRWLAAASRIRDVVATRYTHLTGDNRLVAAVEENVLFQLENLRTFDFVARRLDDGRLRMNGWVFKIQTGQVFDYDPTREQFVLLAAEGEERAALSSRPPPTNE